MFAKKVAACVAKMSVNDHWTTELQVTMAAFDLVLVIGDKKRLEAHVDDKS
jgi:hypothetical protein